MARGKLVAYDSGINVRALLHRSLDLPSQRLGGLHAATEYEVSFEPPVPSTPEKAFLEVGMLVRDVKLAKWRLWVNTVAVTREFKPSIVVKLDDVTGYYAKAIYDLKPVLASTSPPYKLTIQYEGSPELEITDLSLLALYPDSDSTSSYQYYGGAVALEPGDSITVDVSSELGSYTATLVALVPSKAAEIVVECNGASKRVAGLVGVTDVRVPCRGGSITITHRKGSIQYFPRSVVVTSLVVENVVRREPDLAIEAREAGDRISVRVVNRGAASPDAVVLIAIRRGIAVERVELGPLPPGKEAEITVGARPPVTLRLVWRFKGETRIRELRLR